MFYFSDDKADKVIDLENIGGIFVDKLEDLDNIKKTSGFSLEVLTSATSATTTTPYKGLSVFKTSGKILSGATNTSPSRISKGTLKTSLIGSSA